MVKSKIFKIVIVISTIITLLVIFRPKPTIEKIRRVQDDKTDHLLEIYKLDKVLDKVKKGDQKELKISSGGGQFGVTKVDKDVEHGYDSVVRANSNIKFNFNLHNDYKTNRADYKNYKKTTFYSLKLIYKYFLIKGKFYPKLLNDINGTAIKIRGVVMPVDPVKKDGVMKRFWLANPVVVMAGCAFCNPPTMADLIFVDAKNSPYIVDREKLYKDIVMIDLTGKFLFGPFKTDDGIKSLFKIEYKSSENSLK